MDLPEAGSGLDMSGAQVQEITPADPERYIVLAVQARGPRALQPAAASTGNAARFPAAGEMALAQLERVHRLQRVAVWPAPAMQLVYVLYRLPEGAYRDNVIESVRHHVLVRSAGPLQEFTPYSDESLPLYNDPYLDLQRGLAEIDAVRAHRLSLGRQVPVAVVDTSVDAAHPELQGRLTSTRDLVQAGARPEPLQARHGTEVAGIIGAAAHNGQGIVGVAPASRLGAYRACWYASAAPVARCNTFTLTKALHAVLQSDARIVNMSLGGPADPLLEPLLRRLIDSGRIVVAALPPSGKVEGFPAGIAGVVVVGTGENRPLPSSVLGAPGRDVLTLLPGGAYGFDTGSSLATAHVSGVAALMLELEPGLSAADLKALLGESANRAGNGTINANLAISALDRRKQHPSTR